MKKIFIIAFLLFSHIAQAQNLAQNLREDREDEYIRDVYLKAYIESTAYRQTSLLCHILKTEYENPYHSQRLEYSIHTFLDIAAHHIVSPLTDEDQPNEFFYSQDSMYREAIEEWLLMQARTIRSAFIFGYKHDGFFSTLYSKYLIESDGFQEAIRDCVAFVGLANATTAREIMTQEIQNKISFNNMASSLIGYGGFAVALDQILFAKITQVTLRLIKEHTFAVIATVSAFIASSLIVEDESFVDINDSDDEGLQRYVFDAHINPGLEVFSLSHQLFWLRKLRVYQQLLDQADYVKFLSESKPHSILWGQVAEGLTKQLDYYVIDYWIVKRQIEDLRNILEVYPPERLRHLLFERDMRGLREFFHEKNFMSDDSLEEDKLLSRVKYLSQMELREARLSRVLRLLEDRKIAIERQISDSTRVLLPHQRRHFHIILRLMNDFNKIGSRGCDLQNPNQLHPLCFDHHKLYQNSK